MHFRKLFFVWAGGGLRKTPYIITINRSMYGVIELPSSRRLVYILQNYFIANFDMSNIVLP